MLDLPRPLRRPVPIEKVTRLRPTIPIPLDRLPELGYAPIEIALRVAVPAKILTRGQQAFHQERSLHQIAAIFEHTKHRPRLARVPVHEVRPGAVITLRAFEEIHDPREPFNPLDPRDEIAVHTHDQRANSHTGRARRYNAV